MFCKISIFYLKNSYIYEFAKILIKIYFARNLYEITYFTREYINWYKYIQNSSGWNIILILHTKISSGWNFYMKGWNRMKPDEIFVWKDETDEIVSMPWLFLYFLFKKIIKIRIKLIIKNIPSLVCPNYFWTETTKNQVDLPFF